MNKRARSGKLLNLRLMHMAARLHYLDGLSQVEVARRMEVSTASVSRLLALARTEGVVRIEVVDLEEADDLGTRLSKALGLKSVQVVEGGPGALSEHVGEMLQDAELPTDAVVAVGWGRTIHGIISAGLPPRPGAIVIPAMGGMNETAAHFQINEFVRRAAEQLGGTARLLFAPSMVSPELSKMLEQDPNISALFAMWDRADAAILGIGRFDGEQASTDLEFPSEDAGHVVGDVLRHYFDKNGEEIRWKGQERLLSIRRDQLADLPLSIGAAIGREKAEAILGAVRSGMINALVTDPQAAVRLLEIADT